MKITQRLKYFSLVATAFASFSAYSQTSEISPYIINGQEASTSDFPYMGLLYINYIESNETIETRCGGTLIDDRYVLTAAHCVEDLSYEKFKNFEVAFNINKIKPDVLDDEKRYGVEAVYYPSNYDSNEIVNDIAILKLTKSVDSSLVNPSDYIQYDSSEIYRSEGYPFVVIGYGLKYPESYGNNHFSDEMRKTNTLQQANVSYLPTERCPTDWNVSDKQICTTGEVVATYELRTGTCQGDSGGPLLYKQNGQWYQAGITSYGPSICGAQEVEVEGVYTEVSDYADWIASVLNSTEKPKYDRQGDYRPGASSSSSSSGGSSGGGATSLWLLMGLALLAWRRKMHAGKVL